MQNKANFGITKMSTCHYEKKDYENEQRQRLSENKPNLSLPKGDQTQLPQRDTKYKPNLSTQLKTGQSQSFDFTQDRFSIILVLLSWLYIILLFVMIT